MAVARPISPIPRLSSARARRSAAAAAALPAALASSLRPPCAARRADLLDPTTPSRSPPRPPVLCKRTPAWPLPLLSAGALGRTASAAPTDDAEAPAATSVAAAFVANSTSVGPPAATNRGTSTTRLAFKEGSQVLGAEPCGDTTTAVSRFRLRDTLSSNSDSSTKDDCLVSRRGVDGRTASLAPASTGDSPPSDVLAFNRRDTESPAPLDSVASSPVVVVCRRKQRDDPCENAAASPDAPISEP